MRNDKEKSVRLRLQGKSYTEISKLLDVPKSTLSSWLSTVVLSEDAKNRLEKLYKTGSYKGLLHKAKAQTQQAIERTSTARTKAAQEITHIGNKELFYIGLGLYLGEGHKRIIMKNGVGRTYHPVSLSNSDPVIVKLFIKFLRKICLVPAEKIKLSMHIYSLATEQKAKLFWRQHTGLSDDNFRQSYFGVSRSSKHKKPHNHLPHGTLKITVHDTMLYHRIMGWLSSLQNLT